MASIDSGSVLPPPRYGSHEFAPPYLPCSSGIPNSVATSVEGQTSSPRCGSSMKPISSVSMASLNHTPAPSPSYPVANSWPGIPTSGPSNELKNMVLSAVDHSERRPRKHGIYVFNSKMANDSYDCVQQGRYESMLAWHEANCRPSTSTAAEPSPARLDAKRKSTDAIGRTPDSVHPTTGESPKLKKQMSESGPRISSADPMNVPVVSSSSDMLVSDDGDVNPTSDNPLRRMERMTEQSLFEPPARVSRGASSDLDQAMRKTEDDNPERETKLAKLKSLEKVMNGSKTRVQPQCSQAQWDRMIQEQEAAMKIPPGYPQQMVPGYPSQGVINGPPPYQMASHGMPPGGIHAAFRRAPFIGQMSPQVMSPIPPSNGPVMEVIGGPGMPMSQPVRPSLNPPPYSMHMAPDSYMPYEFAQQPSFSSQTYPMTMSSSVSPAYSPMFPAMNGAPVPTRGYSVYAQAPRPMYAAEKMVLPEMWGQQLPQPLNNLEARIPNQKIQYHPNGAVIDENLGETVNNMNPLFG